MTLDAGTITLRDGTDLTVRPARRDDIPAVVELLLDDPLGRTRESTADQAPYEQAFDDLAGEANQHLLCLLYTSPSPRD